MNQQNNLEQFFRYCSLSILNEVDHDQDPRLAVVSLFQSVALDLQLARKQAVLKAHGIPVVA